MFGFYSNRESEGSWVTFDIKAPGLFSNGRKQLTRKRFIDHRRIPLDCSTTIEWFCEKQRGDFLNKSKTMVTKKLLIGKEGAGLPRCMPAPSIEGGLLHVRYCWIYWKSGC